YDPVAGRLSLDRVAGDAGPAVLRGTGFPLPVRQVHHRRQRRPVRRRGEPPEPYRARSEPVALVAHHGWPARPVRRTESPGAALAGPDGAGRAAVWSGGGADPGRVRPPTTDERSLPVRLGPRRSRRRSHRGGPASR